MKKAKKMKKKKRMRMKMRNHNIYKSILIINYIFIIFDYL